MAINPATSQEAEVILGRPKVALTAYTSPLEFGECHWIPRCYCSAPIRPLPESLDPGTLLVGRAQSMIGASFG